MRYIKKSRCQIQKDTQITWVPHKSDQMFLMASNKSVTKRNIYNEYITKKRKSKVSIRAFIYILNIYLFRFLLINNFLNVV